MRWPRCCRARGGRRRWWSRPTRLCAWLSRPTVMFRTTRWRPRRCAGPGAPERAAPAAARAPTRASASTSPTNLAPGTRSFSRSSTARSARIGARGRRPALPAWETCVRRTRRRPLNSTQNDPHRGIRPHVPRARLDATPCSRGNRKGLAVVNVCRKHRPAVGAPTDKPRATQTAYSSTGNEGRGGGGCQRQCLKIRARTVR